MVPSKIEWLIKTKRIQHEGYYRYFYCLLALGTWNKTKKIRFSVKVDLLPEREKDPLLLPYTHIPSSSTEDFILHLQYYQRCESMIFKMRLKSKFVLWQPPYYDCLKKIIRKFTFLKYSFFKNVLLLSISRNSLQTSSLDDILLGNFTLSNSIISVKDLVRWKKGFETFLIDDYAGDIENKNITGKY